MRFSNFRRSAVVAVVLTIYAVASAQTANLDDAGVSDAFLDEYTTEDMRRLVVSMDPRSCDFPTGEVLSWNWRPEYTETSADMDGRVVFRALHAVCREHLDNREISLWMGFRLTFSRVTRAWEWDLCIAEQFDDLELGNGRVPAWNDWRYCPRPDYVQEREAWERSLRPRGVRSVEVPIRPL